MDETLIENAQDDVDGSKSRDDENKLVGQRVLKRLGSALKGGVNGVGNLEFEASGFNVLHGWAKGRSGGEIEGKGDRRENALVIDGKRGIGGFVVREGAQRNELPRIGRNVDGIQCGRGRLKLRSDFQNDVVLIQAFVNVGDLALAESIAKRVVDVLNGDPQA